MASTLPDPCTLQLHRPSALPVTVVTGFLGSGKTTLIRRLLAHEIGAATAVIVNEFGEIALDHLLLEYASDDIVLLPGGCLCCHARNDLVSALRTLHDKRERRELPPFGRVIIETSGLADPGPILQTFLADPISLSRYRLAGLVAVIDALHGARQLEAFEIARLQTALADRIVISKLDIAEAGAADRIKAVVERCGVADIEPAPQKPEFLRQLFAFDGEARCGVASRSQSNQAHSRDFVSISRRVNGHVSLPRLVKSLDHLAAAHGENLLRLKGVLDISGEEAPLAIHVIQHLVDRPRPLPSSHRNSERAIVVIVPSKVAGVVARAIDRMIQYSTSDDTVSGL